MARRREAIPDALRVERPPDGPTRVRVEELLHRADWHDALALRLEVDPPGDVDPWEIADMAANRRLRARWCRCRAAEVAAGDWLGSTALTMAHSGHGSNAPPWWQGGRVG